MDPSSTSCRRDFLQTAGLSVLSYPFLFEWFAGSTAATAAETVSTAAVPAIAPLNRFPRMMQDWLVDQVRLSAERGTAQRNALKTKAEAEAYVKSVQERIRRSFGPFPEKTPLNARVTKTLDRPDYRIEKVIFESRPGYPVTGNLYLPVHRKLPVPGVIGLCGHSLNGKAAEAYQSFAQALARLGMVCFIIDPVGQGERFQYLNDKGKSRFGGSVAEHIQMGNQQTLVGEFLGSWFAWDGIRALDYLLTRPEIDPAQVGVTGNSGGGTQTTWLCGLEPRFTMGAPACFVTTFLHNTENELPADTEQCPPGVLALDLDHSDFLAAMAPKPVIILAQEKDFFDTRGSVEAYERLKQLYTLLGKPDNIQLQIGPDPHGYTQPNREAMYRFFGKVTGLEIPAAEPVITLEKDEDLWSTQSGQVSELAARTLMSFTRDKAESLAAKRMALSGDTLKKSVAEVLKLSPVAPKPADYRILRSAGSRKYASKSYCTYAVETEPHIHALVTRLSHEALTSRIPGSAKQAILYVSHRSADAELRDEPLIRELMAAAPEAAFYACDVRGIGDSQPDTCGVNTFLDPYGSHYFYAAHGLMLDRPLLGQRTFDVLRVIQLLVASGHQEVHLAGRGWGALPATFAALLSNDVHQVTLKHALTSFGEIATADDYRWPYAIMLPAVLKQFDLQDCYTALNAKKLRLIETWGAVDGMKA